MISDPENPSQNPKSSYDEDELEFEELDLDDEDIDI